MYPDYSTITVPSSGTPPTLTWQVKPRMTTMQRFDLFLPITNVNLEPINTKQANSKPSVKLCRRPENKKSAFTNYSSTWNKNAVFWNFTHIYSTYQNNYERYKMQDPNTEHEVRKFHHWNRTSAKRLLIYSCIGEVIRAPLDWHDFQNNKKNVLLMTLAY